MKWWNQELTQLRRAVRKNPDLLPDLKKWIRQGKRKCRAKFLQEQGYRNPF